MAFEYERHFFQELRQGLQKNPGLVLEIEGALTAVHDRYDTTIWANRFVAGGVTEQIIGSAARSLGIEVNNAGKLNQGYDLELPSGEGMSIKAVFASKGGQVRLINNMGPGTRQWQDAAIFPMTGVGIGYLDPDLTPGITKSSGDALVIPSRELKRFWADNPEWLIDFVAVAEKSKGGNTAVASDVVAFELFQRFPTLMENFRPEI